MIVELLGVLRNAADGGQAARPIVQNINWTQSEDGVVLLSLIDTARETVAIPVGGRFFLTVRSVPRF